MKMNLRIHFQEFLNDTRYYQRSSKPTLQLTCAMGYWCDQSASILHPFYLKQDSIQQVLSLVISVNFLLHM